MNHTNQQIILVFSMLVLPVIFGFAQASSLQRTGSDALIAEYMAAGTEQAAAGHASQAQSSFESALTHAVALYGASSLEHARLNLEAGALMMKSSEPGEAKRFLVQAHDYFSRELGRSHSATAVAAFHLGTYWMTQGREQRALPLLESSLAVFEQSGSPSTMLAETHAMIVKAHEHRGAHRQATAHLRSIGQLIAAGYGTWLKEQPIYAVRPAYREFDHCRNSIPSGPCYTNQRPSQAEVAFDVDEHGFVSNVRLVNRQGDVRFGNAAVEAVQRFRYAPRIVDGRAVPRENMTFTFETAGL